MKRGEVARRAKEAAKRVGSRAQEQENEQADLQELAGYMDDLFSVVGRLVKQAEWIDQYQRNVKGVGPLRSPLGKKYLNEANQVMKELEGVCDTGGLKKTQSKIGRLGKALDRAAWE